MRNDLNRDMDRRNSTSGMMIGALALLFVLGVLFMWAPWSNAPRTADNTAPGTTVGSTTRPATPAAPTAPAPAAPAPTR